MGLFDSRLFSWMQPKSKAHTVRQMPGGRITVGKSDLGVPYYNFYIEQPSDYDREWSISELDIDTLDKLSPAKLTRILADLSPEVSAGIWYFLRLCNPGWEISVVRVGEEDEELEQYQELLEAWYKNLPGIYATQKVNIDTIIDTMFVAAFVRGAVGAELVVNDSSTEPLNIAVPDPASMKFRRIEDEELGTLFQLGQWQSGNWVDLDYETIWYVPVDPWPAEPYGRIPISPAIFSAVFLLGMLHDLRRVVAQQGYPRISLSINMERLMEYMPDDLAGDPEEAKAWIDKAIEDVQNAYEDLEPDSAYIHPDIVEVNMPVGTVDAHSLGAIDALVKALERMLARALKTMPLIMGIQQSMTETNANRQWEIEVAGVKSIQHKVENLLQDMFEMVLRIYGVQAQVRVRFAELRASEEYRDAQTKQLEVNNLTDMYWQGWISQNEASIAAVGHEAVEDAPLVDTSDFQSVDPALDTPGGERARALRELRETMKKIEEANGHYA